MTVFGTVSSDEWRLGNIDEARKKRLLGTSFESIVESIAEKATPITSRLEAHSKHADQHRALVTLRLPSKTVDLFHNGASGYRAQFYLGIERGERANTYCIASMMDTFKRLCARDPDEALSWDYLAASFSSPSAKIWIHEGPWLSDHKPSDGSLNVARWKENASQCRLLPRFDFVWAQKTPACETVLEFKGGFVDQSLALLDGEDSILRSRELYDYGYT